MTDAPAAQPDRDTLAAIALGANLGDRSAAIASALTRLDGLPGIAVRAVSSLLETKAVGGPADQPDYLNACALLETTLGARALLERMLEIEAEHGRDRAREQPWGPRTLDLDLLTYGDRLIDEPGLTVPHARLTERWFVLAPLHEIAPDLVIPGTGRSVRGHLEALA